MKVPSRKLGFTIVELLIVIVVIAILAAITIVSYNGITKRAIETSMRSDLRGVSTLLETDFLSSGNYPSALSELNGSKGVVASNNSTFNYVSKNSSYCISIANSKTELILSQKSGSGQIQEGGCEVTVSTLAGNGVAGFKDGTGSAARLSYPYGLAVGPDGTIYVADEGNHRIRKITPEGVVSTFAGSGSQAFANGTGTAAAFSNPSGVAVASDGTVYVSDAYNHRIRKITPDAIVSTFAGSGNATFANGTGAAASFWNPGAIALDGSGNVYVADTSNHRIRKITPGGVVTTLAGSGSAGSADGVGTAASFNRPIGLAVNGEGVVYVADTSSQRIRKIAPDGSVTTVAGSGLGGFSDGNGSSATFSAPSGIAIDTTGTLYVADYNNNRIRMISPSGDVTTIAGTGAAGSNNGVGSVATFHAPKGIAIDAQGVLYVSDRDKHDVRRITP